MSADMEFTITPTDFRSIASGVLANPIAEMGKGKQSAVDSIMEGISSKEAICLILRFKEKLKFAQIAERVGWKTTERARQVTAKAIRKMNHPKRVRLIMENFGQLA